MMKKTFYIELLVLFMGVFVLGSCSKDDDEDENPLVGTWILESGNTAYQKGWTFNSDYSFIRFKKRTQTNYRFEDYGTYSISGNILTVNRVGERSWDEKGQLMNEREDPHTHSIEYSISGNTLRLIKGSDGEELLFDPMHAVEETFIKQ